MAKKVWQKKQYKKYGKKSMAKHILFLKKVWQKKYGKNIYFFLRKYIYNSHVVPI